MAEANPTFQLNELLDFDPVPELVGKPMDFADFLNLDGFESAASGSESVSIDDSDFWSGSEICTALLAA